MKCFCDNSIAGILSINRNAINAYFGEFCIKILKNSIRKHSKEFGIFELDGSYFGVCRIRGRTEFLIPNS